MTPAEEVAAKRLEAESLIREHAPARLQDQLIALLRPAIALTATRTDDAQILIGASKFGGAPDVPSGFEWPTWNGKPLGFLAQINFEEVAAFDVENELPESGLLSFFYDVDEPEWTDISSPGSWRVLFFESVQGRTSTERESGMNSATMGFSGGWSSTQTFDDLPEDRHAEWRFDCQSSPRPEFQGMPYQGHQMLGYGSPIIVDPAWSATRRLHEIQTGVVASPLTQDVHQWLLLFQLDSDEELNTMWGDVGTLYFLIRRDDLQARRFDQTWMELQYT